MSGESTLRQSFTLIQLCLKHHLWPRYAEGIQCRGQAFWRGRHFCLMIILLRVKTWIHERTNFQHSWKSQSFPLSRTQCSDSSFVLCSAITGSDAFTRGGPFIVRKSHTLKAKMALNFKQIHDYTVFLILNVIVKNVTTEETMSIVSECGITGCEEMGCGASAPPRHLHMLWRMWVISWIIQAENHFPSENSSSLVCWIIWEYFLF